LEGAPSTAPKPIQLAHKSESDYRDELVHIFGIPNHLLRDSSKVEGGLQLYYKKYQTCIEALSTSERMANAGEWVIRKPSETEVVELFIGKTMWHSHFKKMFSRVPKYPEMQRWLNDEEDALPAIDIWGEEKSSYTFKDLSAWMEKEDNKARKKGKGKAKEVYKGKKKGRRVDTSSDSDEFSEDEKKKKKKKKKKDRDEGSSKKHFTRSKGKM
jgi:hypothetical protein